MSEPRIYSKNYVNADDTVVVSHGGSSFPNAYDGDKDSYFLAVASSSDLPAGNVSVEIIFYEGSRAIQRTIDRLILVNHNLKNFLVQYWDGSDYQLWQAVVNLSNGTSIIELPEVTTSRVRLILTATNPPGYEKTFGELILCRLLLDPGRDMSSYDVSYTDNSNMFKSGDGGVKKQVKRFSPNRFEKYAAKVSFEFLDPSILDDFYTIKKTGVPFLWQPESIARPEEIFFVNWSDAYKYRYLATNKSAGFRLEFTLTEV